MFNLFKNRLSLTLLALLASPSCLPQESIQESTINQSVLEQIIEKPPYLQLDKPHKDANKSYEEQLVRETNTAMDSFYQYWQTYPTIADFGLILIVCV